MNIPQVQEVQKQSITLGKQFKASANSRDGGKNLAAAVSMEDICSINSVNQKSPGAAETSNQKERHQLIEQSKSQLFTQLPPEHISRSSVQQLTIPHSGGTFGKDSENNIKYKLMEKAMCTPNEFKLIELAILSLESHVPINEKRSNPSSSIFSQRALVESLEQVSQGSQNNNHIYRQLLKIYEKFIGQISTNTSADSQIQILCEILNDERYKADRSKVATETYGKCLMQKGFLSLLDNMAQMMKSFSQYQQSNEVSFRNNQILSSKNDDKMGTMEQLSPQRILEGSPGQSSGSPSPAGRRLLRKLQKESSPVRAFLNDDDDQSEKEDKAFTITELHPSIIVETENAPIQDVSEQTLPIEISSMFDKNVQAQQSSRVQSSKGNLNVQPSIFSNKTQTTSKTLKSSENFKIILKCMRIWKIFTKQEILRREQAKIMDVQRAKDLERDIKSELELSQEIAAQQTEFAIAMNHRENRLLSQGLQALIENIFEQQLYLREIKNVLELKQGKRMMPRVFHKWYLVAQKIKKQNQKYEIYQNYYIEGLVSRVFKGIKVIKEKRSQNQKKISQKREWKLKKKIFDQVLHDIYQTLQIKQDLAQKHFNRQLKAKSLQHLKHESLITAKRTKVARKELNLIKKQKVFKQWNDLTQFHQKYRLAFIRVEQLHLRNFKQSHFIEWFDLTRSKTTARDAWEQMMKKKVIKCLLLNLEKKEKKEQVVQALHFHIQQFKLKIILQAWQEYAQQQQKYRSYQLHVFQKMDSFRLRQVLKGWFNQIDVLKRWRFLNENTEAWQQRKMRRRCFKAWSKQILLKKLYFQVSDTNQNRIVKHTLKQMVKVVNCFKAQAYLEQKTIFNFKHRFLMTWFSYLGKKHVMRFNFKNKVILNFKRKYFRNLRKYKQSKQDFKQGMKKLLQMRANNLVKIAFVGGLKMSWRQRIIEKNMNQVAQFFHASKLTSKSLKVISRRIKARKNSRITGMKHYNHLKSRYLKTWINTYIKQDVAKRYEKRREVQTIAKCFKALYDDLQEKYLVEARTRKYKELVEYNLMVKVIGILLDYKDKRQNRRKEYLDIKTKIYQSSLLKTYFRELRNYSIVRAKKSFDRHQYTEVGRLFILRRTFKVLRYKADLERREKKLTLQVKNRLRFNCMAAINRYATNKIKSKMMAQKIILQKKALVFDAFFRYKSYKNYFLQKEQDLAQLIRTNMKKSVMNKLICFKLQSKFDKETTLQIRNRKIVTILREWKTQLDEAIEERQERDMAKFLFMKHMFSKFRRGCHKDGETKVIKMELRQKQIAFYQFNAKRRGLQKLEENMNDMKVFKLKREYAIKIQAKRVFNAWRDSVIIFRRKRLLIESAQLLYHNQLLERGLTNLREYADKRIKYNLIIDRFQERSELYIKAESLLALHNNVKFKIEQREKFYNKIVFLAEKRMKHPILMWKEFAVLQRLEQKADKFFRKRSAQYIIRLAWDSLRIFMVKRLQKQIQYQAVDAWHDKLLRQKAFVGLKMVVANNKRIDNVTGLIRLQNGQNNKKVYFQAFKDGIAISKVRSALKQKALRFFKQRAYRKCLIGLQLSNYRKYQINKMRSMVESRIQKQFMLKWNQLMKRNRALAKMVDTLQNESDSRTVHKFFPIIIHQTFMAQIIEHMSQKRTQNYQMEFVNQLRKKVILKKILKSIKLRNSVELKRAIFIELRLNVEDKHFRKSAIGSHLEQVEGETNGDILQIAFNSLKEHVVLKKFKKISINCYRLKCLRKYFCALEEYQLKQKIMRNKSLEIRKIQEAKYLWHWRQAYLKEKEKNQVSGYLQSTVLHQIVQQWRTLTQNKLRSAAFHKHVTQRNILSNIFVSWANHVKNEKWLKQTEVKLREINRFNTEKRIMYSWLSQTQVKQIEKQMSTMNQMKILRDVVTAWKEIKDRKNAKRLRVHQIREQMRQNPELARPLKVMRNFTLFKAWNKLFEGSHQVQQEDELSEKAHFAYYLRQVKKVFLSLKLNVQVKFQEDKAYEIADLFLMRRWLRFMQIGTSYLKSRRKLRHKASIFRFLSLQKKAFGAMIQHSVDSQELRIKKEFAMKLYYKRLLDLGFTALRAYKSDKQQRRQERRERQHMSADLEAVNSHKEVYSPSIIENQVDKEPYSDQQQVQYQYCQNQNNN